MNRGMILMDENSETVRYIILKYICLNISSIIQFTWKLINIR